jgi:hypothetical protein
MYVGSLKFLKSILNNIIIIIVKIVIENVVNDVFQNKKNPAITTNILFRFSKGNNTEYFSTL